MATFTKQILSGSTDGRGTLVAATSSPGTLIHTGSTTASTLDEVYIYAENSSTSSVKLTLQWGGTTADRDDIEVTLTGEAGLVTIAPGLLIKGNATALEIRAFAATTNVISIFGFVNRITV